MRNALLDDRGVDFLLDEVLDAPALLRLPYFAAHGRETFSAYLDLCRRFAREVLFPAYRPMDEAPPREGLAAGRGPEAFYRGKLAAAQYWIRTELPRVAALAALCAEGEDSYGRMRPEWF